MSVQKKCKECGAALDSRLPYRVKLCSQECKASSLLRIKKKHLEKLRKISAEHRAKTPISCLYCEKKLNAALELNARYCNKSCLKAEKNKRRRINRQNPETKKRDRETYKRYQKKHQSRLKAARSTPEAKERRRVFASKRTPEYRTEQRRIHAKKQGREFIPRGPLKGGKSERKAMADFQFWLENIASDVCLDFFYADHKFDDHRIHSVINKLKIESIRLLKLEEQPIEHVRMWKKHAVKFCRYCDTQIINAATGRNRFKLCSDACKRAENLYNLKRNYGSKQT